MLTLLANDDAVDMAKVAKIEVRDGETLQPSGISVGPRVILRMIDGQEHWQRICVHFKTIEDAYAERDRLMAIANQSTQQPQLVSRRLFVWDDFATDYTPGLAVAVAESVQEAQGLVIKSTGYCPSNWGCAKELPLDASVAFSTTGGG